MIGKLKGIVDSICLDHAIIDVNGIGYLVFCSAKTLNNISVGETVSLCVETHVREDHIHLYGFSNNEEKTTFITLRSVKGVGTKMSLAILSALSPNEITYALAMKDTSPFHQVSGVGKKLAERIVTELKDKYSSGFVNDTIMQTVQVSDSVDNISLDAIAVLVTLGISKIDAQNRVNSVLAQNKDISINTLIRFALRNNN